MDQRGPRPAPELDDRDSAPGSRAHETASGMMRRAAAEGARHALDAGTRSLAASHPTAAKLVRWVGGALLFAVSGGTAGYVASSQPPIPVPAATNPATTVELEAPIGCDGLLVQHVAHQSRAGEDLARQLEANGLGEWADHVRNLTSIDHQPDDVRICALLVARRKTKTP